MNPIKGKLPQQSNLDFEPASLCFFATIVAKNGLIATNYSLIVR
jgi:hypothetical protein